MNSIIDIVMCLVLNKVLGLSADTEANALVYFEFELFSFNKNKW